MRRKNVVLAALLLVVGRGVELTLKSGGLLEGRKKDRKKKEKQTERKEGRKKERKEERKEERQKGRKKERTKERTKDRKKGRKKERNDEIVNVKGSGNFVVWWFTQQRQEAVTTIGTFLQ